MPLPCSVSELPPGQCCCFCLSCLTTWQHSFCIYTAALTSWPSYAASLSLTWPYSILLPCIVLLSPHSQTGPSSFTPGPTVFTFSTLTDPVSPGQIRDPFDRDVIKAASPQISIIKPMLTAHWICQAKAILKQTQTVQTVFPLELSTARPNTSRGMSVHVLTSSFPCFLS